MKQGRLRIYFSAPFLGIFRFVTLPLEISDKTSYHTWKFCRDVCDTPWRFLSQKPRPMEIPHFFLITTRNSTTFLIDPQNFHKLFLKCPCKFHILNPPFGFFLHSCTNCLNLEMEPKYLTKSDFQLNPNISRTKNDERVL